MRIGLGRARDFQHALCGRVRRHCTRAAAGSCAVRHRHTNSTTVAGASRATAAPMRAHHRLLRGKTEAVGVLAHLVADRATCRSKSVRFGETGRRSHAPKQATSYRSLSFVSVRTQLTPFVGCSTSSALGSPRSSIPSEREMKHILIFGVILFASASNAQTIECSAELPAVRKGHWSYRIIDGRTCWYQGPRMIPKSSLRWTTGSNSNAQAKMPNADGDDFADPQDGSCCWPALSRNDSSESRFSTGDSFEARWRALWQ